jgi:hypothetical protein
LKAAENAAATPGPWVLDFDKVDGSYSYLDATLGELLTTMVGDRWPGILPAARNISETTLDELMPVLRLREVAIWTQVKGEKRWRVAGDLDDSARQTLLQLIAADSPLGSMQLKKTNDNISQSGWANRLTALARLRLVYRERIKKTFTYRVTPQLIEQKPSIDHTSALFVREAHGIS